MDKTDDKQWHRTSPLAVIFFVGRIYKLVGQNSIQTFGPLFAVVLTTEGNIVNKIVLGAVAFVTLTTLAAVMRYLFFRYRITDDSILIREGVLKKTQLDIKFDRIQAINTRQNIVFRQFGLTAVQFDTAGSSKQEGHLPAIKIALADALKQRIQTDATGEQAGVATDTPAAHSRKLLQLTNADVLRIGLSSRQALLFVAILIPLLNSMGNRIDDLIDENTLVATLSNYGISPWSGVVLAIFATLVLLLLLAAASIAGAFFRYYEYELRAGEDTLRSNGGLLTRHEQSINLAKIQSLLTTQNPVLILFKRYRLRARQASSGKHGINKQFVIPICEEQQLPQLAAETFGNEFTEATLEPRSARFQSIEKPYVRSRNLLFGVLPSFTAVFLYSFPLGKFALIFLIWIPVSALWVWNNYRKHGYFVGENGMVLRTGFIGYQTNSFLHRKVQRISITQTLLQERKGLATIRFYLASGSLRLPYVNFDMAKSLRDHILYKVESSQLAWH